MIIPRKKTARCPVWKRAMDIVLALAAIILMAGPMLIIALLICLIDGHPVIYRQTRLGLDGKRITIYKFRSMCKDADERFATLTPEQLHQYRKEFKIDDDPRVTKLGGILRRTSLDELPQLWNILRGDLSIVGPRPILPDELLCYQDEQQKQFLSVRPGLTGYWQACSCPEDTYTSGKRQLMELYYTEHVSICFDVRIILATIGTVLRKAFR